MTNKVDIPRAEDSALYITEYRDRSTQARKKRRFKSILAAMSVCVLFFTGFAIAKATGVSGELQERDAYPEEGSPAAFEELLSSELHPDGTESVSATGYEAGETDVVPEDAVHPADDAELAENAINQKVYLTFDDGPSENTSKILDILDEYGVKATFFVLGREDDLYDDVYRRIVNEGHTLGMHSFTHKYSEIYSGVEAFEKDFKREREFLFELTGVYPSIYRFPGGSSNNVTGTDIGLLTESLKAEGISYFDWNVSSGDANGYGIPVSTIVGNATRLGREERAVILFHDGPGKGSTVEALPIILRELLSRGNLEILPITQYTLPVRHIGF